MIKAHPLLTAADKHNYKAADARAGDAALSWSIRQAREAFEAMPEKKRLERLAAVIELLQREKASGRVQPSPLWLQAGPVFGINVKEL